MKKRSFYGLFIPVLLYCSAGISYACNLPPQANIDGCPKYTAVDYPTYFDGYSSDPDGYIVDWRWTFPPQAYDFNDHIEPWKKTCKFSPPGIYTVSLEVEDNEGLTDTFNCTVYAIEVYITGHGAYIPVNTDDDNENSIQDRHEFETVDDEDDLFEISLTMEPDMPNGSIKLQIGMFEGALSVWAEPNKAISVINPYHPNDPTTEIIWSVSGPFSKTVWVEGCNVDNVSPYGGLGVFYLHPTLGHAVDTDGSQFNPVQVCLFMDGVIEDNEEFPGNYILYNKDDDDNDGVIDYNDGFNKDGIPGNDDDENTAEDDLVKIIPHWVEPANCIYGSFCSISGSVTFNVSPVGTKVKVWIADPCYPMAGKLKDAQITLPEEYETPDDLPKVFYVEGFEPSDGPRDVVFTLTYNELGFEDRVKVTVVHVEPFIDANYTKPLDDWPKPPSGDLIRSPKYMFGKTDPVYVQVKNIGKDPDEAECFDAAVAVKSQSSGYIYMDLQETGVDTEIFRNSIAERGELLYLSTEDIDDYPVTMDPDKITVINEEVLYFYLTIPPGNTSYYKRSEDVMVDRAEIGVEWQDRYADHTYGYDNISSHGFSEELYQNINTYSSTTWFRNFKNEELDSKKSHWYYNSDSDYADSVDIAVWTGHGTYSSEYEMPAMVFFKDNWPLKENPDTLYQSEIDWGDNDADWVVIHNCFFLYGTDEQLKQLVSSLPGVRCAHLICGFPYNGHISENRGEYFAEQLGSMSIKQAWFKYGDEKEYPGCQLKVFGAASCMDDSVAGPGPIEISRDPTIDSNWTSDPHTVPED